MVDLLGFPARFIRRAASAKQARGAVRSIRDVFNVGRLKEVVIDAGEVILRVEDGRGFVWDPEHPGALLTIPQDGHFEEREYRFVRSWLRPGDTVLDVGANFGWYTTLFRQLLGEAGAVHSFEPVPRAFKALQRHVQLNPSDTPTTINPCALGESAGTMTMHVPLRSGRGTAFASFRRQDRLGREELITVETTTVSAYLRTHGIERLDLIKCDVEGAELAVAKGALPSMDAGIRPVWLVELSARLMAPFGNVPADFLEVFTGRDYLPCDILPDGTLRAMDGAEVASVDNLVLVPRERVAAPDAGPRVAVRRA